jgi:hypothetical protein
MTDRPISAARVAKDLLGKSPGWFYAHRPELEAAGFPKPLPVIGRYWPPAVQVWLDRNGGKLPDNGNQNPNAPWKRAVV